MTALRNRADWRTPTVVLITSGIILTLAMGIRHGFGLFLQPMSADLHWGRETFALAIAVQNLVWGVTAPFAGMFADRFGTHRVVARLRAALQRSGSRRWRTRRRRSRWCWRQAC